MVELPLIPIFFSSAPFDKPGNPRSTRNAVNCSPLTFANTGDLKSRLRRLEDHGTGAAHPALPRVRRAEHNKNLIFDVHGVTSLDGAGAQVLLDALALVREDGLVQTAAA